jgi:hypothetical protein
VQPPNQLVLSLAEVDTAAELDMVVVTENQEVDSALEIDKKDLPHDCCCKRDCYLAFD